MSRLEEMKSKLLKKPPRKNLFIVLGVVFVLLIIGLTIYFILSTPVIITQKVYDEGGYGGYGLMYMENNFVTSCWANKDNLAFFLFIDDAGQTTRTDNDSDPYSSNTPITYILEHTISDGSRVIVKYKTKSGKMSIDGKIFYLEKGRVFLCSVSNKPIEVRQLAIPIPKELEQNQDYTENDIIKWINSNREIRKFISIE